MTSRAQGQLSTTSAIEADSSPSRSPHLKLQLTPDRNTRAKSLTTENVASENTADSAYNVIRSSVSTSPNSGLKLKLRNIQAALKESVDAGKLLTKRTHSQASSYRERSFSGISTNEDYDTDSEIDLMPSIKEKVVSVSQRKAVRNTSRRIKKAKYSHDDSGFEDDEVAFDAGDEDGAPASPESKLTLSTNILKRSERILDPSNPEHAQLIATAKKAGPEYYDSDSEDFPDAVKDTNKPHLFRNVKWGSLAEDYSNSAEFTAEPEFTQFVPGRYERLPDGTASDQKGKLIIKLLDKSHRQRIFLNPPPRDWNNQEAITALNKRTVQQIRRNTGVRFREVVEPYVMEEREWILKHLTNGKPSKGWKRFVDEFNQQFKGKVLKGEQAVRPERSHSSLTKEVERFGKQYSKGVVPKTSLHYGSKKLRKGRKAE
ncbi:hypothetical protein N0V94_004132 [Neodidymelliopsis sp. IMI 364377]|nr:hypothetical protein N0V94_004132 [Neodidymelliopsis sp. IMI 364377]